MQLVPALGSMLEAVLAAAPVQPAIAPTSAPALAPLRSEPATPGASLIVGGELPLPEASAARSSLAALMDTPTPYALAPHAPAGPGADAADAVAAGLATAAAGQADRRVVGSVDGSADGSADGGHSLSTLAPSLMLVSPPSAEPASMDLAEATRPLTAAPSQRMATILPDGGSMPASGVAPGNVSASASGTAGALAAGAAPLPALDINAARDSVVLPTQVNPLNVEPTRLRRLLHLDEHEDAAQDERRPSWRLRQNAGRGGNKQAGNGQAGNGQAGDGQAGDGQAGDGRAGDGRAVDGHAGGEWRDGQDGEQPGHFDGECEQGLDTLDVVPVAAAPTASSGKDEALAYGRLTASLAAAAQHAALREIELGRRVLLLMPLRPEPGRARVHVLGLDRVSIGRVHSFSARWSAGVLGSAGAGWRHWRVHQETSRGRWPVLQTSAAARSAGDPACVLRLGAQPATLQDPGTACLDIADGSRFLRALGAQWSLLIVLAVEQQG